jgi:hypothetical protein
VERAIRPDCENCIYNEIAKLSDEDLYRRGIDLDKRIYAISTVEELETKIRDIQTAIQTEKNLYGGGTNELLEKLLSNEEPDSSNPKPF